MIYLSLLWSLLPVPIGFFCLFLSWRIRNKGEGMRFYRILFLGLGIGAILLGGIVLHPAYVLAAKGMFFLTIIAALGWRHQNSA